MANRFGEEKDVDIRADDPVRPDWERDAREAAELAATQAAFGAERYMGDAHFELDIPPP